MARDKGTDRTAASDQDPDSKPGKLGYKLFAGLGAAVGTRVARKALTSGWTKATGKEPPTNPEHPDVRWGEAVSWVIASTAAVATAKLIAQRRVAATWRRASGTLPPGLDEPSE